MYLVTVGRIFARFSVRYSNSATYICCMELSNEERLYKSLRLSVEQRLGKTAVVTSDFKELSENILENTKGYLAPITLRRFWSDKPCVCYNVKPKHSTLDILSQYVGYSSWESFVENNMTAKRESSSFLLKRDLPAEELQANIEVELSWAPDRVITIRSLGNCTFRVQESRNSKLSVGDTFRTMIFVEGEPLLLTNLIHDGEPPTNYVCGRIDGIRYRIKTECDR